MSPKIPSSTCNPCGRKIRNLGTLYELLQNLDTGCKTPTKPASHSGVKSKRLLDTPEGSSPCRKTIRVNSPAAPGKAFRKSLQFGGTGQQKIKSQDTVDSFLNIDDLPSEGDLQIKVVIVSPKEHVVTRIPRDDESKTLIRQLCFKKWKAASNTIVGHQELYPEVEKTLTKRVSDEASKYLKSESILLSKDPDKISGFASAIFLEEVRIFCPLFYRFLLGASGLNDEDVKIPANGTNEVALAAATLCRARNPKASALHYRISTMLFHSGVKHEDLGRLNRLGVCMSPDAMVRAQNTMSKQLEGKVIVWKNTTQENKVALLLSEEVRRRQVPVRVESDMEVNVGLDLDGNYLKTYESFTKEGYNLLREEMSREKRNQGDNAYTEVCLAEVDKKLP